MAKTIVHENESIDDALRRFKRSVSRSGTLQAVSYTHLSIGMVKTWS